MLARTMPFHALCYLIASRAGDLIAQSDAPCADSLDATGLCRLIAYHTEATGGRNVCLLDLSTCSLIVRPFEELIVAATIPPGSQVAEAHFEVHLLAVLCQLGTLQFGNLHLGSFEKLQHSGSNPSQPVHSDLRQFRSYRQSVVKGLSVLLQVPGVCFAELLGIDVCDKCFQIDSLPADDCIVHSHKHAYTELQQAIYLACSSLQNVALSGMLRSPTIATHSQQRNIPHQPAKPKTTFSAICLDSNGLGGQRVMHRVAAVKCLRILDLHTFILAWSDVHLLCSMAQQTSATKQHVTVGKAAVPADLRFQLNIAATVIKNELSGYTC